MFKPLKMFRLFLATALVCVPAAGVRAQVYEAVGVRAQGMGAFVAVADDATASWWNPAGLATGRLLSLVVERGFQAAPGDPPVVGPGRRDAAGGFSVAFPSLALSYYRVRATEVAPLAGISGGPDAEVRTRAVNQYGMTVGQSIGQHLVVATTLALLKGGALTTTAVGRAGLLEDAGDFDVGRETKGDLDLGAMAAFGPARFGLSVKHLRAPSFSGGNTSFVMSRQARAGVALMRDLRGSVQAVTLAADADLTRTSTVNGDVRRVAAGLEAWMSRRRFALRSGVSANTIGDRTPSVTVGASVGGRGGVYIESAATIGGDKSRRGLSIGLSMTY